MLGKKNAQTPAQIAKYIGKEAAKSYELLKKTLKKVFYLNFEFRNHYSWCYKSSTK